MTGSPSAIVSLGYGSWGSVNLVVTRGYGTATNNAIDNRDGTGSISRNVSGTGSSSRNVSGSGNVNGASGTGRPPD